MFAFFVKKKEELKQAEPREVQEILRSQRAHFEEFELKLIQENSVITGEIVAVKGDLNKYVVHVVDDDLIQGIRKEISEIEAVTKRIFQLDRLMKEHIIDLMKLEGIVVKKSEDLARFSEKKDSTSNFEVRKSLAKIFCCCWRSREKVAPETVEMEEFSPEQRIRMRQVQCGAAELKRRATELNEKMKKQGK